MSVSNCGTIDLCYLIELKVATCVTLNENTALKHAPNKSSGSSDFGSDHPLLLDAVGSLLICLMIFCYLISYIKTRIFLMGYTHTH